MRVKINNAVFLPIVSPFVTILMVRIIAWFAGVTYSGEFAIVIVGLVVLPVTLMVSAGMVMERNYAFGLIAWEWKRK